MKIEAQTLKTLLSTDHLAHQQEKDKESKFQIQIPIYQRKYCWTSKIVKQFHNDLTFGNAFGHHIGKIFFQKKGNGHRMCIDGQQRLTTLLIGICALRDVVLEEFDGGEVCEKILQEIHELIFVKKVTGFNLNQIQQEYISSEDKYSMASKIAIEWSRLVPSHDDRVSFIEILIGLSGRQELKSGLLQNTTMHNTREIFFKIFKPQVMKQEGKFKTGTVLSNILPSLSQNAKFVIVEYDECEINAQDRFGELYDVGKGNQILFYVKSPGIDLSYSDLIKNHLLSKLDEGKQLQVYENYWLKLERNFVSTTATVHHQEELQSRKLDLYLEWFLYYFIYNEKERIEKYKERMQQMEAYERMPLIQKLGMCGKETNFTLYSQFVKGIEKSQIQVEKLLESMIEQVNKYFNEAGKN